MPYFIKSFDIEKSPLTSVFRQKSVFMSKGCWFVKNQVLWNQICLVKSNCQTLKTQTCQWKLIAEIYFHKLAAVKQVSNSLNLSVNFFFMERYNISFFHSNRNFSFDRRTYRNLHISTSQTASIQIIAS